MYSPKSKQQGAALFIAISGLITIILVLFLLIKLAQSGYYADDIADITEDATKTRIMPSGNVTMGDGTEVGQRTGSQVFNKICIQCHGAESTVAYAPKVTHKDQWGPRIAQGYQTLIKHAIEGFQGAGTMPPRGGAPDLTDDEVARAIAFMANQSGANFTPPEVKATAASNASAPAAAQTASAVKK